MGRAANGANGAAGAPAEGAPGRGDEGNASGAPGLVDAGEAGRGGAANGGRAKGTAGRDDPAAAGAAGVDGGVNGRGSDDGAEGVGLEAAAPVGADVAGVAGATAGWLVDGVGDRGGAAGAGAGCERERTPARRGLSATAESAVGARAGAGAVGGWSGAAGAASDREVPAAPPAVAVAASVANSRAALAAGDTVITPPQTEHRARTDVGGILAGSTRKTDRHSGHVTFTTDPPREPSVAIRRFESRRRAGCPCGGRSSRPTLGASLRSSSSRLRVR